jgi:hypothetical protein
MNRAGGGEKGVLLGRAASGFKMLDLERLPDPSDFEPVNHLENPENFGGHR